MTPHAWLLTVSLVIGFSAGFLVVKADLNVPGKVRKLLQIKEYTLLKTILWLLIAGMLVNVAVFYLEIAEFDIPERGIWPSLIGGVIAGTGLVLWGMSPTGAVVALGRGRLSVLFAFAGMLLAFPAAELLRKFAPEGFSSLADKMSTPAYTDKFFAADNAVLWCIGTAVAALIITTLADSKK